MASTSRSTRVRSRSDSRRSFTASREPSSSDRELPERRISRGPRRTGRSADAGQDVFHRELQRPGDTLEHVRAGIGQQTDGADGFLAARLEIAPQALGDLGPAGGITSAQSALLALLGEPPAELHPLLRFVHAASVPVPGPRVQPVGAPSRGVAPGTDDFRGPEPPRCGGRTEASPRDRARTGGDWTGRAPRGPESRFPMSRRSRGRPRPPPARRWGCSSCRPGTTEGRR